MTILVSHITSSHPASNFMTSKQVTSPPWNSRRLIHSKEIIWIQAWKTLGIQKGTRAPEQQQQGYVLVGYVCDSCWCTPFEWIRIEWIRIAWIRIGGIRVERIRIGGIRIANLLMQTFWMDTHCMDTYWWDTCWTDTYWWDTYWWDTYWWDMFWMDMCGICVGWWICVGYVWCEICVGYVWCEIRQQSSEEPCDETSFGKNHTKRDCKYKQMSIDPTPSLPAGDDGNAQIRTQNKRTSMPLWYLGTSGFTTAPGVSVLIARLFDSPSHIGPSEKDRHRTDSAHLFPSSCENDGTWPSLSNKRTSTTLRSVLWRPFVALLQNSFPLHPNQDTFPHHFPVHSRRAIAPLAPVQLSTFKVGSTWVKGSGDTFYHLQTILLPFLGVVTLEEHIWIYLLFSRPASFIKPHGTYWAPQMEMLKSWGVVTELFPLNTSDAIKMHILLVSKKPRQWRNCTTEMDG